MILEIEHQYLNENSSIRFENAMGKTALNIGSHGFDCQWISDYSNEQEVFFIGGANMRINNIIDVLNNINYAKYLQAMHVISRGFTVANNGGFSYPMQQSEVTADAEIQQLAFRLLSHLIWKLHPDHPKAVQYESCPEYIYNILSRLFTTTKSIGLDHGNMVLDKVQNYFFDDKNGWIDLELSCMICPNVATITSVYRGALEDLFQNILQILLKHRALSLWKIEIRIPKYKVKELLDTQDRKICDQYGSLLGDVGWEISEGKSGTFVNSKEFEPSKSSKEVEDDPQLEEASVMENNPCAYVKDKMLTLEKTFVIV